MNRYSYRFKWKDSKTKRTHVAYLDAASQSRAEKDFEAEYDLSIEVDAVSVSRIHN